MAHNRPFSKVKLWGRNTRSWLVNGKPIKKSIQLIGWVRWIETKSKNFSTETSLFRSGTVPFVQALCWCIQSRWLCLWSNRQGLRLYAMERTLSCTRSPCQQHWWRKLCRILLYLLPAIHQRDFWLLLLQTPLRIVCILATIDSIYIYIYLTPIFLLLLLHRYQELKLNHVQQRSFGNFEFRWTH